MNILRALKRCSLGLDLYLWDGLPHLCRSSARSASPGSICTGQFGTDPDKASDKRIVKIFRRQALRELKKIKTAWPDLNYATAPGVLILLRSKPAVPPAQQLQLVR